MSHTALNCIIHYTLLLTPYPLQHGLYKVITASHISKVSTMVERPLCAPQRKTIAHVAGQTPEGRIQGTHVFHRDLLRIAKVNVPDGHTTVT